MFLVALVLLPHVVLVLLIFRGDPVAGVAYPEAAQGGLWRFVVVGLTAALLQALFISSWQRFRVQMRYLQHFYSREELEVSQQPLRVRRLSARLWVTNTMTTFLPISIMVTYVVWSIAPLRDPIGLSSGELAGRLQWAGDSIGALWYVNPVDRPAASLVRFKKFLPACVLQLTTPQENVGFIDRFIGDAIMALFESRADGAFAAALEMQQRLRATDLGLTKHFGCAVLVTRESVDRLSSGHSFLLRPLGRVSVSGRRDPVEISELLDPHLESDRIKDKSRSEFAEALALYQHGKFEPARD